MTYRIHIYWKSRSQLYGSVLSEWHQINISEFAYQFMRDLHHNRKSMYWSVRTRMTGAKTDQYILVFNNNIRVMFSWL